MSKFLEKTQRFLDNLVRLGYDENRAFRQLSTFDNLETEISQLTEARDNLKRMFDQEQQQLTQMQRNVVNTRNAVTQVNGDMTQAGIKLYNLSRKIEQESYRIEFAKALCQLFEELPRISVESGLLIDLSKRMETIYETGMNHRGYPIDYSKARATAIHLLEQAIGKGVVLRENYDRVVKQHDDLMLDKLGKMEKEREEIAGLQKEALDGMLEFGLKAAVFQASKGLVVSYRCPECKTIIAHSITDSPHLLTYCPLCQATLRPFPISSLKQPQK